MTTSWDISITQPTFGINKSGHKVVHTNMPTYEYRCTTCGEVFEDLRQIDERLTPESEPCPSCKSKTVKLKVGGSSLVAGVTTRDKRPDGFRDVLKNIKKHHPLGVIDP